MPKPVIIIVLVVATLIGWLVWNQAHTAPFVVSGFIEADTVRVGSRVGGRIAEVMVAEGSTVEPGQPMLRIDPFDLNEQLAQSKSTLAALNAELTRLRAGYRPEEIEQARAQRDEAASALERLVAGPRKQEIEVAREQLKVEQANLDFAQSEYERLKRLETDAQAAPRELEEALRLLRSAQGRTAAAQQSLALLEEGSRKEDIAAGRAALAKADSALNLLTEGYRAEDIAQAEAQMQAASSRVAAIEVQMKELVVSSPCHCVVEAVDLQPGDLISPNAPTIALLDQSRLWVRAYIPESRLGQVSLGQDVPVAVDSFPGERFPAKVTFLSREAEFTPKNIQTPEERSKQVFRIKATLQKDISRLRVGMAADLRFDEQVAP